jgi:arginine kinase
LENCRKNYLNESGKVDWDKVQARWNELKNGKVSLANKYFTQDVYNKSKSLPQEDQQRLLDIMMGGLENNDSSVGVYATRPEDYDTFAFYLETLIRDYHGISGDTKQEHDWNVPQGKYLLTNIHNSLDNLSMRARVARNVAGWNLPPKMDKDERLRFEARMVEVFESFPIPGNYHSLTPNHKNFINQE